MPSVLSRPENASGYHNGEDDVELAEDSPLLRMPLVQTSQERNIVNMFSVLILILVLVIGTVTGIYLLVLQNRSDNILPPELRLIMAKREHYVATHRMRRALFSSNKIYISETNTTGCRNLESCNDIIANMQSNYGGNMPYHIFVSNNGIIMKTVPPPAWKDGFNIALFGAYENMTVPTIMVEATADYLDHMTDEGYLDPYYKVIVPKGPNHNLYKGFKKVPNFCKNCY